MDKQKQLNEMHQILLSAGYDWWKTAPNGKTKSEYETECFYNAGYRKIPEGAVVLTGMETEQRFKDLMVAFDEMGFMPNTTHPFPEEYVETWKQRLIFVFGHLRKETAEKFAEKLKAKYDYDELLCARLDEICKEITEGE